MTAPADVRLVVVITLVGCRSRRFAHGLGEGHEIVVGRRGWAELTVVAHEIPAAGRRQSASVGLAEIV